MIYENIDPTFGGGVLPVAALPAHHAPSTDYHEAEVPLLQSFIAGSSGQSHPVSIKEFVTKDAVFGPDGKIKLHPTTYSASGATSGGDFGWQDPIGPFDFDPFGDNNLPPEGLDTVVITGQKTTEGWWSWPVQIVSDLEDIYINEGGAGASGTGDAHCGNPKQSVDWQFIGAREGNELVGSVPSERGVAIGHSGVTIASGFDLGQHNANDLARLNLGQTLTDLFTPYLGLQRADAINYLRDHPLSISNEQAEQINAATHAQSLFNLVVSYDSATHAGSFYELPSEVQTVLASVAFQYGDLGTSAPVFWNQVTHQLWNSAEAELRSFGDRHQTRRALEADLLHKAIDEGRIHDGSNC